MQKRDIIDVLTAEVTFDFLYELDVYELILEIIYPNSLSVERLKYALVGLRWYETLVLLPCLNQHVLLLTVVFAVLIFGVVVHENDLHKVPEVDILISSSDLTYPVEEVVPLDLLIGDGLHQYSLL